MTIVIGINSLTAAAYPAYSNHIGLFYNIGRWSAKGEEKHNIILVNPARMSIDRMRNLCAKTAIENNADYVLFIDDDVIIPQRDVIEKLISADADIVAGDVIIRGYPFNHMSFIGNKDGLHAIQDLDAEIKKQKSNILTVGAVGFSLCLIKTEVLKKIAEPWFVTGLNCTEDIYFCLKAKEFIPDVSIKLNTEIQCGHILWEEIISRSNKKDYTTYMESQNPHLLEEQKQQERMKKQAGDRGDGYLKDMKKAMKGAKAFNAPSK